MRKAQNVPPILKKKIATYISALYLFNESMIGKYSSAHKSGQLFIKNANPLLTVCSKVNLFKLKIMKTVSFIVLDLSLNPF